MSKETKQEIKEMVTKLANANLEFTIEDELEFAKVAVKSAEQKLEQVKQENKRLLEIINAKPLETVDMDCAFEIEKLKEQLEPFNDGYFEHLDTKIIAELAKKSIRLTTENRKLENVLDEIQEIAEGMHDLWINKTKYTDIDNLVKHLLECELSRIIYKLYEISESEVEE